MWWCFSHILVDPPTHPHYTTFLFFSSRSVSQGYLIHLYIPREWGAFYMAIFEALEEDFPSPSMATISKHFLFSSTGKQQQNISVLLRVAHTRSSGDKLSSLHTLLTALFLPPGSSVSKSSGFTDPHLHRILALLPSSH